MFILQLEEEKTFTYEYLSYFFKLISNHIVQVSHVDICIL